MSCPALGPRVRGSPSRVSSPCVIRPSPLSALRIMAQLANSFASFACTRCVVCEPGGACHARPSARVSSTGLETQGPEASLLLLQRNLVYAPLRSAHHRGPSQLAGSIFQRKEGKNLLLEISFIPRGEGFFGFFCRLRRWGGRHPAPTRVPLRVCGTQAPASEMGTGNSASHLRVCRTNLDG